MVVDATAAATKDVILVKIGDDAAVVGFDVDAWRGDGPSLCSWHTAAEMQHSGESRRVRVLNGASAQSGRSRAMMGRGERVHKAERCTHNILCYIVGQTMGHGCAALPSFQK